MMTTLLTAASLKDVRESPPSPSPSFVSGALAKWASTVLGLSLMVVLVASCAAPRPWERGRLAHECMQLPVDVIEMAYHGHVEAVREGSTGGAVTGGGGCGCN